MRAWGKKKVCDLPRVFSYMFYLYWHVICQYKTANETENNKKA